MTQAPVAPVYRYYAFISYSHQDKSWADWLHKALETYRVPSRLVGEKTSAGTIPQRLVPVFRDREELASATDLSRRVNEALAQSANLIVICSPRSAASRWVNEEVLAYKRLGRGERVFCLIVDGEPNASDQPGNETLECFAPALRFHLGAHGQPTAEPTEPIAADARAGKDGKAKAKLKLIAGMLDVGFDSLRQRELQRRHRRMTAITALALIVMAVTSMLAIAALFARHTAEVARIDAERHQRQAEDLVGFMLGDLNDRLYQVQRIDIMQAVDDKAMSYFASLPTKDVTPQALAQRAKALEKIGTVRQNQGRLPDALASFQAAAELNAMLAQSAPADTERQLQYARNLAFIGQTYWYQGQLDAAGRVFDAARAVLLGAERHATHDLALQYELEMIDNDLGHVLEARGQIDEAQQPYRSALALSQALVDADPSKAEWRVELGGAHNNIGKLALLQGDLATAIAQYRADDAIESSLLARDPKDNSQRDATLTVRAILGRTLALAGADDIGMRHLQQAVDMACELIKVDARNTGFQDDLVHYSQQLARLKRLNGDLPQAQALIERSLPLAKVLVAQSPTATGWQRELAETQLEWAAQSVAAGNTQAARLQVNAAMSVLGQLLERQPHDRTTLLSMMNAQLLLASISTDPSTATPLRRAVIGAAQSQPSGRDDPRLLALQVEAMLALGDKTGVQGLIRQLWSSGFRDAQLVAVLQQEGIAYPVNTTWQKQLLAQSDTDDH
ncbi:TIR domain-containing protein [Dyella sp. C9]|uniref:TIR domain-containing protein n=1 Tax=Dyella sp. C9 TaxID=2202154 RepID=UPI000DEFABDA|nr:TIR domain-containing protein [Dyella sp. C9]